MKRNVGSKSAEDLCSHMISEYFPVNCCISTFNKYFDPKAATAMYKKYKKIFIRQIKSFFLVWVWLVIVRVDCWEFFYQCWWRRAGGVGGWEMGGRWLVGVWYCAKESKQNVSEWMHCLVGRWVNGCMDG